MLNRGSITPKVTISVTSLFSAYIQYTFFFFGGEGGCDKVLLCAQAGLEPSSCLSFPSARIAVV
jgi:hypothetical protein